MKEFWKFATLAHGAAGGPSFIRAPRSRVAQVARVHSGLLDPNGFSLQMKTLFVTHHFRDLMRLPEAYEEAFPAHTWTLVTFQPARTRLISQQVNILKHL